MIHGETMNTTAVGSMVKLSKNDLTLIAGVSELVFNPVPLDTSWIEI